jgi:hypothetical protein
MEFPAKTNNVTGDVLTAVNVNNLGAVVNLLAPSAKGALFGASAVNAPSELAVGADGSLLVANSAAASGLAWAGNQAAGKNKCLNADFSIWQAGTSGAGNAYYADQWYSALISGTGTFAQEATVVPVGAMYCQKFTASATAQVGWYQPIETLNALALAGKTVTVSAQVAASVSTPMTIDVQYSTSVDNGVTGAWTSITAISGGTATPTTTTFVTASGVYAIPATAKSLRLRAFTTSTILTAVVVYFGEYQIEVGSVATPFAINGANAADELVSCQRFYETSYNSGFTPGTATGVGAIWSSGVDATQTTSYIHADLRFKVVKRAVPTLTIYDAAGTINTTTRETLGGGSTNGQNATIYSQGQGGGLVYSNGTAGDSSIKFHYVADARL